MSLEPINMLLSRYADNGQSQGIVVFTRQEFSGEFRMQKLRAYRVQNTSSTAGMGIYIASPSDYRASWDVYGRSVTGPEASPVVRRRRIQNNP